MSDDTNDFYKELQGDFYKESLDLIERFESVLLENENPSQDHLNELFRIAHTIKGGAAAVGLEDVSAYTHKVEDFLTSFKNNMFVFSKVAGSILLEFADILRNEFVAKIEGNSNEWSVTDNLIQIKNYNPDSDITQHEDETNHQASQSKQKETTTSTTKKSSNNQVKVDNDRLDSIFNTIGEVVILKNQLLEHFSNKEDSNSSHLSETLNVLVKDLYDKALGLRLTSIRPLFQRLQRTMRDLSTQLDKNVQIDLIGDDTEIDRSFFDILSEPLIHLVRNAIDHGIEKEEKRLAKNKSPKASVELKAYYQSGQIVIEIKDDGNGIDAEKVFNKAKSQNLIPENSKISDFSSDQIFNFIFLPGFSTAEKLTDVSGRGVGLDVVKSAIEKVHGKIFVESQLNVGSSFKLFLPMTTSLVEGVVFNIKESKFIVPARSINTILNIQLNDLKVGPNGQSYFLYQNNPIPVINIAAYLKLNCKLNENLILVITEDTGLKFGCLFETAIGQVQTVVKPTPAIQKRAEFIGVSVLGDGFACLIIDLISVYQGHKNQEKQKIKNITDFERAA